MCNSKINLKCINCNKKQSLLLKNQTVIKCNFCYEAYPVIEGIIITLNTKDDFFNYKKKLKRYIEKNN